MWIRQYNRDSFPFELDNHEFGTPTEVYSITRHDSKCAFGRTVAHFPGRLLKKVAAFGKLAENTNSDHLQQCYAFLSAGWSDPIPGYTFTPDHAFLFDNGREAALVEESLWHSQLFFSEHVRCDRSTDWQWRVKAPNDAAQVIEDEVVFVDHQYRYQYFHWFMDCLPRIWLRDRFLPKQLKIAVGVEIGSFQMQSMELFGIGIDECVFLEPNKIVRFEHAIVPGFRFSEPLKTIRPEYRSGEWHIGWSPEYFAALRSSAINHYRCRSEGHLRIFISRSDAHHRKLRNEVELQMFLEAKGFLTVAPGKLSLRQQVELFAQAAIIVGVHGAGLTNLIWAKPGCIVIELAPFGLRDVGYRFSAQFCGHQFATVLCRTHEHVRGLAYSDIEVDLDDLRQALAAIFLPSSSGNPPGDLRSALLSDPDVLNDTFRLAEQFYDRGDVQTALEFAELYVSLRPRHYWCLFLIGKIHRDMGNENKMEKYLERAVETDDPDRVGALFELSYARIRRRELSVSQLLDEAIFIAESSQQKRWYFARLHFLKALMALDAADARIADQHFGVAYNWSEPVRESEFLFEWVKEAFSVYNGASMTLDGLPFLKRFLNIVFPTLRNIGFEH